MTQIGSVYGEALYELACSEGLDKAILDELKVLDESFHQEPGFVKLLCSHSVSKQERCQVLDDSFRGKVNQYLLNFLKILTEKGYMHHFTHCCEAYTRHYNEDHNILSVRAVTAVPLTDKQAQALTQKLTRMTGKTILLENRVDATCLGGVRLDYDGRRLDDTICHRMESIRELLKNTVL
ncbi:MAG: ATP synthase F1 subunit delta [Candidatus Faecousia sp.]|nr:ATP synthase F1 subunit delta [Candidatus Faecousia sp.]